MDDAATAGDRPPRRVRLALVGCEGLLGDIIGEAVATHDDLHVVADVAAPAPGTDATLVELEVVDLVVWKDPDEDQVAAWLTQLQRRFPVVLTTLGDGRDASLWRLAPQRTPLGPLSPRSLVDTIRRPFRDPHQAGITP